MTSVTLACVSGATDRVAFTTCETVVTDTPASRATSLIVAKASLSRRWWLHQLRTGEGGAQTIGALRRSIAFELGDAAGAASVPRSARAERALGEGGGNRLDRQEE